MVDLVRLVIVLGELIAVVYYRMRTDYLEKSAPSFLRI